MLLDKFLKGRINIKKDLLFFLVILVLTFILIIFNFNKITTRPLKIMSLNEIDKNIINIIYTSFLLVLFHSLLRFIFRIDLSENRVFTCEKCKARKDFCIKSNCKCGGKMILKRMRF